MAKTQRDYILRVTAQLERLTLSQLTWITAFIDQFSMWHSFERLPNSDLVTPLVLEHIGDMLRIHHATSRRALSKAPFEYAFEKALHLSGKRARLADSSTNPGYDLEVEGERFSLKTEAARNIQTERLHISKWMELGKGPWDPPNIQLGSFFAHMNGYDRILSLRCLGHENSLYWYELIEIPKELMLEAKDGDMRPAARTKQETIPWYCRVLDQNTGEQKFALYFDAGSERKLQVKHLSKQYCIVHASWRFKAEVLTPQGDDTESSAAVT